MTVFDQDLLGRPRPAAFFRRLLDGSVAWFHERLAVAAERRQEREHRAALKALLGKEDWVYRDIGITKADVEWASRLPRHVSAARELERVRDRVRMGW